MGDDSNHCHLSTILCIEQPRVRVELIHISSPPSPEQKLGTINIQYNPPPTLAASSYTSIDINNYQSASLSTCSQPGYFIIVTILH